MVSDPHDRADPVAPVVPSSTGGGTPADEPGPGDGGGGRRLILLRHAKSQWPDGVDDVDRPLAERGVADATAAGPVLAGLTAGSPAVVLCSPALRTRQTWRLIAAALTDPPPIRFEPVIYGADVTEVLELLRATADDVPSVLLIGHEPTMSGTADALAGPDSTATALAQIRTKYPTSAMAVFALAGPWSALAPRSAVLEQFLVPRG